MKVPLNIDEPCLDDFPCIKKILAQKWALSISR